MFDATHPQKTKMGLKLVYTGIPHFSGSQKKGTLFSNNAILQ